MKLFAHNLNLDLSYPHVMGILNVTPDSFSNGGMYNSINNAIDHVNIMIKEGATIIDVGGESTRPGADFVSTDEELSRVIPVIEAIKQRFNIWLSIDTSKPEVMLESAKVGVNMINDVRSLTNPKALKAAIITNLPVCLVHMQGQPENMQKSPYYDNVVNTVNNFFVDNIARCENAGLLREKILIDPGFGFGKKMIHNYQLLGYLSKFSHFNLPLLVGMSRKTMIGQLLNVSLNKRVNGGIACAVIAGMQGAKIIRTHDVKETVEAMLVVKFTLKAKQQLTNK